MKNDILTRSIIMTQVPILVVVFLFTGACSFISIKSSKKMILPEHIYKRPSDGLNRDVVIGVFKFWSPGYAPDAGYFAADILYKDLLHRGFRNAAAEFDAHDMRFESTMEIARMRNYELIITGEVAYCRFGNELQESRVDQEIRVVDALTGETVWYAEAVEIGRPVYPKDRLFFFTDGKKALSPEMLMRKNARKITNMFLSFAKGQEHIAKEMKFVNDGYNYLVDKNYDRAKSCFQKAIEINPANAYALYNLGVVHEKQGNKMEAIEVYKKIVEGKSDITDERFSDPDNIGHGLVDLAFGRLKRLTP